MTDRYAKLRADLAEEDRSVTGFVAMPRELLVSLLADYDRLREALQRVLRSTPTDGDMIEAGWEGPEVDEACAAYDAARAALAQEQGESNDK